MTETTQNESVSGVKPNRKIKDSVFSSLFEDKKYLLQLYQTLHPEDTEATEDSLTDVTIENVLTDSIYNDLGFVVHNRLMILVESQSTWTLNILVRALLYLAQSYHEYFIRTGQNLYKSKKATIPEPELYVIYTGERGNKPDEVSLSKDFFEGKNIPVEVKAKVIYERETNDIVNQYIFFSKVYDEQRKLHGITKEAVTETIRICKDRNILKEYLESKEKEVVTIMMSLFDQEEIMRSYIKSERQEAAREAAQEAARETTQKVTMKNAERMLKMGKIKIEDIPACFPELNTEDIKTLESEILQTA